MKKDTYITEVIFRKWNRKDFKGDIIALFPYDIWDEFNGNVASYEHIGQHCGADYNHCINMTVPAKEEEYKDLKEELEYIGYNLKVINKRNHKKYLTELYKTKGL
jgi:hypothetical protein